jgi:hypothetical protein
VALIASFCSLLVASRAGIASFKALTFAISSAARASSLLALAWPMAFDASLRSASSSCNWCCGARGGVVGLIVSLRGARPRSGGRRRRLAGFRG